MNALSRFIPAAIAGFLAVLPVAQAVRDHGAVAPLAYPVWGGSVATNNTAGERIVLTPVWTGWNDEGKRSSAFLSVNVDTDSVVMSEEIFGDTAFGSFLGADNRLYFSQDGELVAFDAETNSVANLGRVPAQMPLRFTSDDQERIYFSSYPNAELLRYDPQSGQLENFGPMAKEKWPQYPFIAVDADGWVYMVVRHKEANLIGFNPQTKQKKTYLKPEERTYVDKVDLYRAQDGAVYARLDTDNQWRKFKDGQMQIVQTPNNKVKVYRNATRHPNAFADGSRMGAVKIPEKHLIVREKDGTERKVDFDYKANGARIYSLIELNGIVYGSTGLPACIFAFNPQDDSLATSTVAGVLHMNVWTTLNGKLYGGAYSSGALFMHDPAKPLAGGFERIYDSPQARNSFGRPADLIAHPDGRHVIMVGNPSRAISGGGMLIYDTETNTPQLLTAKELIENQGTKSIIALPNGDLIGGTMTKAPTGGVRVASEAVLYRFNWQKREIAQRWNPIANAAEISDLLLTQDGKVLGLTNESILFRFDADSGKLLKQVDLGLYGKIAGAPGLQATNSMLNGPDGKVYLLFGSGVVALDPVSLKHQQIYKADRLLGGSLALAGNTLYFAAGERLLSLAIESSK